MPGVVGEGLATGVRGVGFHTAGTKQDLDALVAQLLDVPTEWDTGGKS